MRKIFGCPEGIIKIFKFLFIMLYKSVLNFTSRVEIWREYVKISFFHVISNKLVN